ncbi:PREDICTED: protein CDV3 homolog [Rhagoletis zephyria]|uniref:protein CDV3 homolog n=1 Tax=Rhagoletis zephyria TaxID=28612 RepID=UPI00081174C8|nr:PREDICTED: protein CDV3 homolog [Rhagoletis zephyria]
MSDLDDFFAKKDKKGKNKTVKKKGLSNDDLEKKFDEKSSGDTTGDKIKARKYVNFDNYVQDAEAEWNDFNDDESKDYSGLKIQTLSMKDKEEVQREEEESTKKEQALPAWKEGGEEQEAAPAAQPAKADSDLVSLFRNRNQIKINDTVEFPDLGTPSEAYEELKGFQTVRTAGPPRPGASANESISTDNKYQALKNNSN